ncbi:MAG: hypothetical protein Q9163_000610 [Psora crenata]
MASTAAEHVLRIPRSDSEDQYVLVNTSSNGPKPLDIKILATEGENPYATAIRHREVSNYRERKNQKSKEEWEFILSHKLLQQRCSQDQRASTEKLEVVATISGPQLGIIFRRNIEGIIQRLGELTLLKDEDLEIDTVRWAQTAVERSEFLEEEVQSLTARYDSQAQTIQKLNQQLDDLIIAKREHESSLLEKFSELLNAKKLKIRDQQRLLATAKIDSKQAATVQAARPTTKARMPEKSGHRKRKTVLSEPEGGDDSLESKHETKKEQIELSETINTPEPSDKDVTEDETDESDRGGQAVSPAKPPERSKVNDEMQLDTPPPSRDLPFGKTNQGGRGSPGPCPPDSQQASRVNHEAGNDDNNTDDDDDDEL